MPRLNVSEEHADVRVLHVASEPAAAIEPSAPERSPRGTLVLLALLLLLCGAVIGWFLAGLDTAERAEPQALVVQDAAQVLGIPGAEGEPVVGVAQAVTPVVVRIDAEGGIGSGIIFDAAGLVVTNAHVVGDQTEVPVQLADGSRTMGQVLGTDQAVDVAVLRLPSSGTYASAVFAPWESVAVGQLAVAVGSPFGLEQTVTAGIVSTRSRVVDTSRSSGQPSLVEMIQTDASINPGNSGGALADRFGRIVGMNSSIRTNETNVSNGVGFALPSDTLLLIAERILSEEPLGGGYLGIQGEDPLVGPPGARISSVVEGQPAALSGMQQGDLVTSFDAQPVESMAQLTAKIGLAEPGTQLVLGFVRAGESHRVIVELAGPADS